MTPCVYRQLQTFYAEASIKSFDTPNVVDMKIFELDGTTSETIFIQICDFMKQRWSKILQWSFIIMSSAPSLLTNDTTFVYAGIFIWRAAQHRSSSSLGASLFEFLFPLNQAKIGIHRNIGSFWSYDRPLLRMPRPGFLLSWGHPVYVTVDRWRSEEYVSS